MDALSTLCHVSNKVISGFIVFFGLYVSGSKNMPICGTGKYECIKNASCKITFYFLTLLFYSLFLRINLWIIWWTFFLVQQTFLFLKGHLSDHLKAKEREKIHKHLSKNNNNITRQHFCYCPDMCNTIDYNVEITESDYDWPRKMATLGIEVPVDEEG